MSAFLRVLQSSRLKERPASEGRNPRTGEALNIPASKWLGFKMSKSVGATL
jgi:nucleoid DNA-binding protein